MTNARQLPLAILFSVAASGCEKTGLDLPPLSEYQDSHGWYEDAFVRVYNSELPGPEDSLSKFFTHPWFVLKPANSDSVVVLQLTNLNSDLNEVCDPFYPRDHDDSSFQSCGYVLLNGLAPNGDIDYLEEPPYNNKIGYIRGELRGEEAEGPVNFILDMSKSYPCKGEYQTIAHNSNTYAEVMIRDSGLREAIEAAGSQIILGSSAWGQGVWQDCKYEPEG